MFISDITNQCMERGITDVNEIAGVVGRGLRAFPSFVREMDLAYRLSERLPEGQCKRTTPEEDVLKHTDILISIEQEEYRVWSYISSNRGLQNTMERLRGKRKSIRDGFHVLCPFNVYKKEAYEEQEGWRFYSETEIDKVVEVIRGGRSEEYQNLMKCNDSELSKYMKDIHKVKKVFVIDI